MDLSRRQIIKGIGSAIIAGMVPKFVPGLIGVGDPSIGVGWGGLATSRSFSDMLNEYLPLELLQREINRHDHLLSMVTIPTNPIWTGMVIPITHG